MNWDALGAIAELAGAVAVVGSMIYLAVQIRQNTLSNRIAAKQNTTDHFTSYGNMMILNPELRSVWRKGRESMANLSEAEVEIFHYLNLNLCWYYSSQHFQHRQGALDDTEWEQSLGLIQSSWLEYYGTREWWRSLDKRRVTKPFCDLIEAEIRKIEAGT